MKEDQIKGYFAFAEADLAANRNGKLSEKQTKKIKENDEFAGRFVLGLSIFLLFLGLLFSYFAFSNNNNIALWIWSILFLFGAGWAFRGVARKVNYSVEKAEGEVKFVKVEKQTSSSTTSSVNRQTVSSYEMWVGGEVFANANPALIELMQGDVYAIYFTKATRQILSVEFVSKGK